MLRLFDFPFSRRDSYAALPWVVAFMVFLTVIAAAVAFNVRVTTARWQTASAEQFTLTLPASLPEQSVQAKALAAALGNVQGVKAIKPFEPKDMGVLLEPWLGGEASLEGLPMPLLIDVTLDLTQMDGKGLEAWLRQQYPDVLVEDHARWMKDFNRLVGGVGKLSTLLVIAVSAMTAMIVTMSTKTELALHRHTVELLRALGAENGYIAFQFQIKSLWMSVQGTLIGGVIALATLYIFHHLSAELEAPLLPLMRVSFAQWGITFLVMIAAVAIAGFAARLTVLRQLRSLL